MIRGALACLLAVSAPACVLADPPATLPVVADEGPVIITPSTTPAAGLLLIWPPSETFIIPVQLQDPTRAIQWKVFLDYNANNPSQTTYVAPGTTNADTVITQEGVLELQISDVFPPLDPGCHTLTVVVAYGWLPGNANVPDPPGGSSVQWIYRCNLYDAGSLADATFPVMKDGAPSGGG